MNLTAEQIIATNKANLQTLVSLSQKAFSGMEQIIELNLATAKSALTDSQQQTQAALSVKDAQELLTLQASLLQPLAEKAVAYNRHLYEIITGTSAEFQGHVEGKVAEAQKAFHDMIDNATKNAPVGSEAAVAAFKTAMSTGNNAMETVQKVVKQATEVAESNIKSMTETALNVGKTAAKKR